MMGQQPQTESLFYYFLLEDQVPEDHLLRLIDRYVDLGFIRDRLKSLYSSTGRPSIDPEVLLRLLLVGSAHAHSAGCRNDQRDSFTRSPQAIGPSRGL